MESFEFLTTFFSAVSGTAAVIICAFAVFIAFTVCLFLSVFKRGYGLKKRVWYFVFAAFFCAYLNARARFTGEADLSSVLVCFSLILALPLCFIRERQIGARISEQDERRRFVRILDDKLKSAREFSDSAPRFAAEEIKAANTPIDRENKTASAEGLDFSHVKNVLSRLEPALLSYADRRQIHDLEMALFDAERGVPSIETRSKINEGLGNLLKIMAKHGV